MTRVKVFTNHQPTIPTNPTSGIMYFIMQTHSQMATNPIQPTASTSAAASDMKATPPPAVVIEDVTLQSAEAGAASLGDVAALKDVPILGPS